MKGDKEDEEDKDEDGKWKREIGYSKKAMRAARDGSEGVSRSKVRHCVYILVH